MNRILWVILGGFLVAGCNQQADLSDLRSFTENAFKDHVPEVDPLPALKPQAVFIYTASSLPDPFNQENLKEKTGRGASGLHRGGCARPESPQGTA